MTLENTMDKPVSLLPYFLQFIGVNIFCAILVALITYFLNFEVPNSMGIITLMASTSFAVQSFVRKQGRVLSRAERLRFAGLAVLANLLFALVYAGAFMWASGINFEQGLQMLGLPLGFLVLFGSIGVAITALVVYFFSGFMGRQVVRQMAKAKAKK
jgi:Kef-type K+ transport system membrane component KefB